MGGDYFGGEVSSPYFGGNEPQSYLGGNVSGGYVVSGLLDKKKYGSIAPHGSVVSAGIAWLYFLFYIIAMCVLIFHPDLEKARPIGWLMLVFSLASLVRWRFTSSWKSKNKGSSLESLTPTPTP